ncbi:phosphonate C-P lyase system protein PhnH [Enterococcus sp. LJL90]
MTSKVFTTQDTFRRLVDAASYVGEIKEISLEDAASPLPQALFQIAETLLDQEVSFETIGFSATVNAWLQAELRCQRTAIEEADFVLCNFSEADQFPWRQLPLLKIGDLIDPQNSGTVLGFVQDLFLEEVPYQLSGPGILGNKLIGLPLVLSDLFSIRENLNQEYPLGIDLILTDQLGRLLFIPRTTQVKEVD